MTEGRKGGVAKRPARRNTRRLRKEATRQSLKDSAIKCFGERGFLVTTIDDITDAAGVAHATFYTHFESKEAIFDEIQRDFSDALFERLTPVLENAGGQDVTTSVRIAVGITLDYWDSRRDYIAVFLHGANPLVTFETVRSGHSVALRDVVTEKLIDYARARGIDVPGARLIVAGITAMWTRVGLTYLYQDPKEGDPISRELAIETLAKMTVGVFAQFLGLNDA